VPVLALVTASHGAADCAVHWQPVVTVNVPLPPVAV